MNPLTFDEWLYSIKGIDYENLHDIKKEKNEEFHTKLYNEYCNSTYYNGEKGL